MTHYLYKPHVLGAQNITTPDLLVDGLYRTTNSQHGVELLATAVDGISTKPELQCAFHSLGINPAYFLIAAGGGVIMSVGAECVAQDSLAILVSRFAWRLKCLNDPEKLRFKLSGDSVSDIEIPFNRFPLPEVLLEQLGGNAKTLPRGVMICVTATNTTRQIHSSGMIEINLLDAGCDRELTHCFSLLDVEKESTHKRPQARYVVGPTAENVQHYI